MDTVGRIDLQPLAAGAVVDHLVHTRGAEASAGIGVLARATRAADVGVVHEQVRRRILAVFGAGVVNAGHAIERDPAVDRHCRLGASTGTSSLFIRSCPALAGMGIPEPPPT